MSQQQAIKLTEYLDSEMHGMKRPRMFSPSAEADYSRHRLDHGTLLTYRVQRSLYDLGGQLAIFDVATETRLGTYMETFKMLNGRVVEFRFERSYRALVKSADRLRRD